MGFLNRLFGKQSADALELTTETSAIQSILRGELATAAYLPFKDSSGERLACFVVHEDQAHVSGLSNQVPIETRCGFFKEKNAGLLTVMLRINGEIYETWWNWCNPLGGDCLPLIAKQDKLIVNFYVDSTNPARTLWTSNSIRDKLNDIVNEVSGMPSWEMSDFDDARQIVYRRYPTPQSLWTAIAG